MRWTAAESAVGSVTGPGPGSGSDRSSGIVFSTSATPAPSGPVVGAKMTSWIVVETGGIATDKLLVRLVDE